ncbi:MAG TPA: hypothetical protein PLV22_01930 [Candidatus Cloacimonadota bacterium]|nr:hypothetical protein [Candidatus Cloacimonadota bacterium]
MKHLSLIIMLLISFCLFAEPVDYAGPDFAQGFYDMYSKNFINAEMAGRGHSGIAFTGGAEYGNHNPATLLDTYNNLYFEIAIKPRVTEFNELQDNKYQSNSPINAVGFTLAPFGNFHLGFMYSLENSLEYYSFSRTLPQTTTTIDYTPEYYNHRISLMFAHQLTDKLSYGINSNLHIHSFKEYRNEGKVDLLNFQESFLQLQPGVLYQTDYVNIGASFLPSVDVDYKYKYIDYKMTIPAEINAGATLKLKNNLYILADTDYTFYSQQADYMENQLTWKLGIEKQVKNPFDMLGDYSLRAGYIYKPKVFSGEYNVPDYSNPAHDEFHPNFYHDIPSMGRISAVDMSYLTVGTSVRINHDVELNLAYLADLKGDLKLNQFISSLKFDLAVFKYLKK